MIIQTVKFKSALSETEIQQVMEERAPQFRALPGLLQKYYLRDNQTGEVGAVYIWDSRDHFGNGRHHPDTLPLLCMGSRSDTTDTSDTNDTNDTNLIGSTLES